jgi:isopentenyldiphosphate isomerase
VSRQHPEAAGTPQQNDPAELLEVFDARGRPTGRAHTREAIHLHGDWHQAFHCWIVRAGQDGREIVLQQRSAYKDTFPSQWDAAAAGHWRWGESPEQAAREIEEELGLHVHFEQLGWVGREREARWFANGLIDREFHQVYALEWNAPLATYRPDPREVSALAAVPARGLLELVAGRREQLPASEAGSVSSSGELEPVELTLRREDLVPYSVARLRRLLAWNPRRPASVGNRESLH